MKKILFLLYALSMAVSGMFAQQSNTVQPSIMVVPFTKEGEDIRQVLEADVNKRAVLTSIKEAFDNRGFSTVDFLGKYKAMSASSVMNDGNQSDIVSEIIANSGADIYITAEIDINATGQGTAINIIMNAYDTATGTSLANKMGNSGRFYTTDIAKLADVAIKKNMDVFLDNLQGKFNDIVANGRSIIIEIGVDEGSEWLMSSEMSDTGNLLSDDIEMWMEENAYKNYYHIQGTSDKIMIFDDVKIPLKDPATGRNYNINRFAMALNKFFKSKGLDISRKANGNHLYISIK